MYKIETLNKIFKAPEETLEEYERLLELYSGTFNLKTKKQFAIYYATVLAEVGEKLGIREENMNYSEGGLKATFKIFRKNPELAEIYGRNSKHRANKKMIANYAYANRLGNGDVNSQDGWRYRGRGFFQITGKSSYKELNNHIQEKMGTNFMLVEYPSMVTSDTISIITSLGYWHWKKMYLAEDINQATRIINRYTNSYKKRERYFKKIYPLL